MKQEIKKGYGLFDWFTKPIKDEFYKNQICEEYRINYSGGVPYIQNTPYDSSYLLTDEEMNHEWFSACDYHYDL